MILYKVYVLNTLLFVCWTTVQFERWRHCRTSSGSFNLVRIFNYGLGIFSFQKRDVSKSRLLLFKILYSRAMWVISLVIWADCSQKTSDLILKIPIFCMFLLPVLFPHLLFFKEWFERFAPCTDEISIFRCV